MIEAEKTSTSVLHIHVCMDIYTHHYQHVHVAYYIYPKRKKMTLNHDQSGLI